MAGDSPPLSCRASVQLTPWPRNLDGSQFAGPVDTRAFVRAAWLRRRLGIEDRALIVGGVFCRAHGRRLPAAFLPGRRTAYAAAEEFGWVSVRGACRSPGFRARGVAAKALARRGSRVNSEEPVLPGEWQWLPAALLPGQRPAWAPAGVALDRPDSAARCSPPPSPHPRAHFPPPVPLKKRCFKRNYFHNLSTISL